MTAVTTPTKSSSGSQFWRQWSNPASDRHWNSCFDQPPYAISVQHCRRNISPTKELRAYLSRTSSERREPEPNPTAAVLARLPTVLQRGLQEPAVDRNRSAVDVGCSLRAEEGDGVPEFLGLSDPLQWHTLVELFYSVLV